MCAVDGCQSAATARGWCGAHYQRWRRFGDPTFVPPQVDKTCTIEGCDRVTNARGYCGQHYYRWHRYGDPLVSKNKARVREPIRDYGDRPCVTCGAIFAAGRSLARKYCSRACRPTRAHAGVNNRATVVRLGDAHGWMCSICYEPIDQDLYWPNPRAGSVDHNTPVALGGTDDWINLQLTHLHCNVTKGAVMACWEPGRTG